MHFKLSFSQLKWIFLCLTVFGLIGCSQSTEPPPAPPPTEPAAAEVPPDDAAVPSDRETKAPIEATAETEPTTEPNMPAVALPDRLLPRPRGLEYGYVDLAGEWALEPQFEDAREFSEELAAVRMAGLYGYIGPTGQMVIEPQFSAAQSFSEGLAAVMSAEQLWGYIDQSGTLVIEPQFDFANRFSEGLADVVTEGRIGFIDPTGETVITPQAFDFVQPFSEGLAVFGFEGLSGYLDPTGKFAIQPQYTFADDFAEGLAVVELEEQSGYIDPAGAFVIEPQFDFARHFSEGLAAVVVEEQVGYIDSSGQMVIEPQFTVGFDFSEGLAAVLVDDLWGYIDPTGKMVIEPQFALASDFRDGLASVAFGEQRAAYIDPTGTVVVEVKPAERVTIETAVNLTPEQISFDYDPSLAAETEAEIVPGETTLSPDVPFFALRPEHIAVTFSGSEVLAAVDYEQDTIAGSEPKLFVYPAADYAKISPLAGEQIEALKNLLAERPESINFEIPVLPLVNAAQIFHSQVEVLDFANGSGLRFITQYAQEPRPITNAEIFYTFQGLTGDGQFYVAFFYPVATTLLPNTPADSEAFANYETFVANLNTYMPETIQRLDALAAENYTPDLSLLDALVESIAIQTGEGGAAGDETQPATRKVPTGSWTVTDYKFGGISAWGETESEALLDTIAEIGADSIAFNGQTCEGLTFNSSLLNPVEYFDISFRILPGTIGISQAELEVITTTCDIPGFSEFMRLDNGQLVLNIEGVFFFLDEL